MKKLKLPEINRKHNNLMNRFHNRLNDSKNERFVITDGIYDQIEYFKSKFRIAWMLKESYDDENGKGGGFNYLDRFKPKDLYDVFKTGHKTTWYPIAYTTYGILNNFIKYEKMDEISNNPEILNSLRKAAYINANKLPAKGGTKTNMRDIEEAISKSGDLLLEQINLYNPNILIFANIFEYYKCILNFENISFINVGDTEYFLDNGKLYIHAYHPAYTGVKRSEYVNQIIKIVEKNASKLI